MILKPRAPYGFTLIEVLIVIAILGVLLLILLPLYNGATQKSKQKGTMSEINSLAKAVMAYVTDHDRAPANPGGEIRSSAQFIKEISPYQIMTVPVFDQWHGPLQAWTGLAVGAEFGIRPETVSADDFVIASWGKDGISENFVYNEEAPALGFYALSSIEDFDKDLILWNGQWIRVPLAAQSGT
jgi:prepilin-type N-terminal cleavage/methylation domain-containing protein